MVRSVDRVSLQLPRPNAFSSKTSCPARALPSGAATTDGETVMMISTLLLSGHMGAMRCGMELNSAPSSSV